MCSFTFQANNFVLQNKNSFSLKECFQLVESVEMINSSMKFTMRDFPIESYKWPMLDAVRCSRSRSLEATLKSSSGDFDQLPSTAEVGFRSSSIDRLMPTLFKMSDDKKTEDMPSVVFTQVSNMKRKDFATITANICLKCLMLSSFSYDLFDVVT